MKKAVPTRRHYLDNASITCRKRTFLARRIFSEERLTRARSLRVQIGSSPIQAEEIEQAIATGRP